MCRKVLPFMVVPWSDACSACWMTLLGLLTIC
jgi:hypothetical protein